MSAIECLCKCFESSPGYFIIGLFFVCLFLCIAISSACDSFASILRDNKGRYNIEDDDDEDEVN